jgi:hypothetical protein
MDTLWNIFAVIGICSVLGSLFLCAIAWKIRGANR